jgi:tetratricopeptide (TPR) repeat protein
VAQGQGYASTGAWRGASPNDPMGGMSAPAATPAPAPNAPPPPPAPPRTATPLSIRPNPEPEAEAPARREPARHRRVDADADGVAAAADYNGMDDEAAEPQASPYVGPFKEIMDLLGQGKKDAALTRARAWHAENPGDVMALVAFGEALEKAGDATTAARAYGSLIDLFPARADLRRFAGERLDRLQSRAALQLAIDTYAKAAEQRPDHPASHRLYAYALVKAGRFEKAFAVMAKGLAREYPEGRFAGAHQILSEDLGLIAAAWIKDEPKRKDEILAKLEKAGGTVEDQPSIRFVLNWETDANDVDFHIHDAKGNHAFFSAKHLASGGDLYADVTTGYGPECFTIRAPHDERAYPYRLQAHYYSRGPMGYGMGKLEIIEHDGNGKLRFDERPYVVMQDQAFVDLGVVKK